MREVAIKQQNLISIHDTLDNHPIPEKVRYINELQLVDQMVLNYEHIHKLEEQSEKNSCIYVSLSLRCEAILCRYSIVTYIWQKEYSIVAA